jgi:dolichol-phosphate mannosyltransferase
MLRLAVDATLAFSVMPLYVATWVGLVTTLIAGGELLYVVITFMRGHTVPGWASTVGITSLLFGVLFLLLGLLNIYITRIYRALQHRPRFIIAEDTRHTRPVSVCPACGQGLLS